jgi:hypothetical protein
MFPGGKSGRCVGLTTLPPSVPIFLKSTSWNPQGLSRTLMGLLYIYLFCLTEPTTRFSIRHVWSPPPPGPRDRMFITARHLGYDPNIQLTNTVLISLIIALELMSRVIILRLKRFIALNSSCNFSLISLFCP